MDDEPLIATFGLDAALNHGCLVRAIWRNPRGHREEPQLLEYSNLYEWNTTGANKMDFKDLCERANGIVTAVQKSSGNDLSLIGIDWDFAAGFMSKGNLTAPMKLSFMIGYLTSKLHQGIAIPFMLKPQDVRIAMGVKGGRSKGELLQKFLSLAKIIDIGGSLDFKDAMLLSWCAALAERSQ